MGCKHCGKTVWIGVGKSKKVIGIFVASPKQCKKGGEVISIPNPLAPDKPVYVCRLGPELRRYDAPKGKPAYRRLRRIRGLSQFLIQR